MKNTIIFICLLISLLKGFVQTAFSATPFGPPIGSATVDGLTMYLTPPLFHAVKLTQLPGQKNPEPSTELKDWELYFEIVLRNDRAEPIQVITAGSNGPKEMPSPEGRVGYYYSLPKIRGLKGNVYVKPKPSDLDIVVLKPGEETLLGALRFTYDHTIDGDFLSFIYYVQPETSKFYDVWTGRMTVEIPYTNLLAVGLRK